MNISPREGEILRRSNMASIARDHLSIHLEAKREKIIRSLLADYREAKFDLAAICGKLGALSIIEDYLNEIDRDIKKSKTTEEKLYESPT
jgi:hypothetical protein